jgi:predicted DNA-binding transcriptional regulator YafY
MNFVDKTEQLAYLLKLIKTGNSYNTEALYDKICVSERTLHRSIDILKRQGHQISFCSLRKSYYLIEKDNN